MLLCVSLCFGLGIEQDQSALMALSALHAELLDVFLESDIRSSTQLTDQTMPPKGYAPRFAPYPYRSPEQRLRDASEELLENPGEELPENESDDNGSLVEAIEESEEEAYETQEPEMLREKERLPRPNDDDNDKQPYDMSRAPWRQTTVECMSGKVSGGCLHRDSFDASFDMRGFDDPNKGDLLAHVGSHWQICSRLFEHGNFDAFAQAVRDAMRKATVQKKRRIRLAFGCARGKHRSVAAAELVGGALELAGYRAVIAHTEEHECRWRCAACKQGPGQQLLQAVRDKLGGI